MELISWSFNAVDKIYSTRHAATAEPVCPDGTFVAGYVMDGWERWRVACLSVLSVEDVEDVYLLGTMITGQLLIGLCCALVYQQIGKMTAAVQGLQRLPVVIFETCRVVGNQNDAISELKRELAVALSQLKRDVDNKMDVILEELLTLQKLMDCSGDQDGKMEESSLLECDCLPEPKQS